ncbi:MAG TPA: hypothetical protein VMU47_23560 [Caldimonas sp.]|nr:hypothetical protein [Caldimonas sp.]
MSDPLDPFVASIGADEPPQRATPLLRAVWHGLRGDWDAAHELAQSQDDAEGAWVHAWLHRIEGDLGNADYWYRRAQRPPRRDDTRTEGLDIARSLLDAKAANPAGARDAAGRDPPTSR